MDNLTMWKRFKTYLCVCESVGVTVDISRMKFSESFLQQKDADIRRAFVEMDKLESGAIANPDEHRMVGHYWLRDAAKAPTPELRKEIATTLANIKKFAKAVHGGENKPEQAEAGK